MANITALVLFNTQAFFYTEIITSAEIGIDSSDYGSHSCRRGGATAAVAANVDIHLVKRHGNWKSDAVYLYVVDSVKARLSVSGAILAE